MDKTVAMSRQVSEAVRKLDSLATTPAAMASVLTSLERKDYASTAAEIIKSDPAMSAAYLAVNSYGSYENIESRLAALSPAQIRSLVLSVPVCQQANSVEYEVLPYSQLVLHSLATARAAEMISDIVLDPGQRRLAYTAGLLHDIGKLALYRVMPKSFEKVAEFGLLHSECSFKEEMNNLGVNHSTLGKIAAEQLRLPKQIVWAIWLHHTNTQKILESSSANKFISVVSCADILARKAGIGHSGSFDEPVLDNAVLSFLGLGQSQTDEIVAKLSEAVGKYGDLTGNRAAAARVELPDILRKYASDLSDQNIDLELENRKLVTSTMQTDFVQQYVSDMSVDEPAPSKAAELAIRMWGEHFKVSPAAIYYYTDSSEEYVEIVSIKDDLNVTTEVVSACRDDLVIPEAIKDSFDIVSASGTWIAGKIGLGSGVPVYMLALLSGGKAVGGLVYVQGSKEFSIQNQKELFEMPSGVVAAMLGRSIMCYDNVGFAERFATLLSAGENDSDEGKAKTFDVVAEMAAGAGHELNNPLTVISGRTQMLAEAEVDPDKKRDLEQIQKRAEEASGIVRQLMNYAKPGQPNISPVAVEDVVKAACEMVAAAKQISEPEITYTGLDGLEKVNVDGNHVMAAMTAVIANAMESYDGGRGLVEITADCVQKHGMAAFLVKDNGRGMDQQTAAKATTPFFSSMPAGRKRGMGLANANRLINLNGGLLKITSIPGDGTTVRIDLPLAKGSD